MGHGEAGISMDFFKCQTKIDRNWSSLVGHTHVPADGRMSSMSSWVHESLRWPSNCWCMMENAYFGDGAEPRSLLYPCHFLSLSSGLRGVSGTGRGYGRARRQAEGVFHGSSVAQHGRHANH